MPVPSGLAVLSEAPGNQQEAGQLHAGEATASNVENRADARRAGSTTSRTSRINGSGRKAKISTLDDQTSEEMEMSDPRLARLMTFQGQKQLLRGSCLGVVLNGCAAIFAESAGSAGTYALSHEVSAINTFISHNWIVPRFKKFLCFIMYWNFYPALWAAVVATVIITVASEAGALPRVGTGEQGFCGALLVGPIFLVTAFFWHKLHFLFTWCYRLPVVFLDKTCIHQENMEMQRESILKLGAFIRRSAQMLVIYSDVYLRKLWTVYEVACFLALHPNTRMRVFPTYLPMLAFGGTLIAYVFGVIIWMVQSVYPAAEKYVFSIVTVLEIIPFIAVLRRWARIKADIQHQVVNFRVQECICAVEEDRPFVYSNISLLMRALGLVADDADEDDMLDAFNEMVRERVPSALTRSVGRFGFAYSQTIAWNIVCYVPKSMEMWPPDQEYTAWAQNMFRLYICIWAFGVFPFAFAGISAWCSQGISLRGWPERLFLGVCPFVIFIIGGATDAILLYPLYLSSVAGEYRDMCCVTMVVLLFTSVPLAILLLNFQRLPWRAYVDKEEEMEVNDAELEFTKEKKPEDDFWDAQLQHL